MNANPLSVLINRTFSSIEFVGDYIQLRFDGSTLSVYSEPKLIIDGEIYKRESVNFCNLMISCIGQNIVMAEVKEQDAINIRFENGTIITISLRPEDYDGVEAAWFDDTGETGDWWVW